MELSGRGVERGSLRKLVPFPFTFVGTALLLLVCASSGSASPVVGGDLQTAPAGALQSWSKQDLVDARPAGTPVDPASAFDIPEPGGARASAAEGAFTPSDIEGEPLRTHGRIFFRIGLQEFTCSGTVVNSRGRNVVMTAGHCVYDTETAGYVDELIFIPAYSEDPEVTAPFGAWAASAVFTSKGYVEKGRLSQDIGAVVLDGRVQNAVGARRIAFDLKASGRSFSIYGYPEKPGPPYDGSTLIGCRSSTRDRDPGHGRPYPIAAGPCDMQDGSSGGGWITAGGFLNSVVSYGYCDSVAGLCGLTFGPFFSSQAKDIYTFPAVGGSIAPTVEIDSGPQGRSRSRQATFRFSGFGSTPVNFRCRLDRGVKFRCAKRTTLKRLKPGAHTLRVRSIDQAGRTSPRAAKRNFSVLPARR